MGKKVCKAMHNGHFGQKYLEKVVLDKIVRKRGKDVWGNSWSQNNMSGSCKGNLRHVGRPNCPHPLKVGGDLKPRFYLPSIKQPLTPANTGGKERNSFAADKKNGFKVRSHL